jgi:hypothetical protein
MRCDVRPARLVRDVGGPGDFSTTQVSALPRFFAIKATACPFMVAGKLSTKLSVGNILPGKNRSSRGHGFSTTSAR